MSCHSVQQRTGLSADDVTADPLILRESFPSRFTFSEFMETTTMNHCSKREYFTPEASGKFCKYRDEAVAGYLTKMKQSDARSLFPTVTEESLSNNHSGEGYPSPESVKINLIFSIPSRLPAWFSLSLEENLSTGWLLRIRTFFRPGRIAVSR